MSADHVRIISNQAAHGGTGGPPTGYDAAGTISGFIITDKPVVTMSPRPVLGYQGDSVLLSSYAIGVPPLTYQWRKNGAAIAGATTTFYSIPSLNAGNIGNYQLSVSNAYGTALSSVSAVAIDTIKEVVNNNLIVDSNPANVERDGLNSGATWLASSSDGTKTRTGVMQFTAAKTNNIIVTGTTNFDSPTGTIMFWMRSAGTDTTNGGNFGGAIFGRPGGSLPSSLMVLEADSGNVLLNTPGAQINSIGNIADNDWHLIVATYDDSGSGGAALYIDGVLDSTNSTSGAWSPLSGQQIQIGYSTLTGSQATEAYNGQLDDVRFYNRELSATEVASVFATGSLIDTNALQLQFTFTTAPVTGEILTWQAPNAVLQSAPTVNGPYSDLNAAISPYYVVPKATQKYFRYRFTHTPQSLISNPYLM
jgi:hypothetical protein